MKIALLRQTLTSTCAAMILCAATPVFANDSIEINLDVLKTHKNPIEKPAPAANKKPAEKSVKKHKSSEGKKSAHKPKHEAANTEPKDNAKAIEPKSAKHKKEHKKESKAHTKAATTVENSAAPKVETPMNASPVEAPKAEIPKAEAPKADTQKQAAPDFAPVPVNPLTAKAPELPLPPTASAPLDVAPIDTKPPALPETPKPVSEAPKASLGNQLTDFVNDKQDTKPAIPSDNKTPVPAADSKNEIIAVPALPPAPAPELPVAPKESAAPVEPAAPLPMDSLPPKLPEKMTAPIPELPISPSAPDSRPALPPHTSSDTGLPTAPTTPPAAETSSATSLPSVPPEMDKLPALPVEKSATVPSPELDSKKPLPPLSVITEEGKSASDDMKKPVTAPANPAEPLKPADPLMPEKTAALPDLAPLPDNLKGDLPSLPNGSQANILAAHPTSASAGTKETAVAELQTKGDTSEPDLRVIFNETETDVPPSLNAQLDSLAQKMIKSPKSRVNIFAYAGGKNETGIYPKRVSLARGIAVRNYLTTTKGIDIERVNVRALGNKSEGGPTERVDIFVVD